MWKLKRRLIHILIDSGSTHNFLDIAIAKGLGCSLKLIDPIYITVANGQEIVCTNLCEKFQWEAQGYKFSTDFLVMPLGGREMVLGIQRLVNLGDITWNF